MSENRSFITGHRLLQLGMGLFFLGLVTGFLLPMMENPRVGLSSHLEAVLNGMLLVMLGLLWPRLTLGAMAQQVAFWLAIYGAFTNWLSTLLAGFWGAGSAMMPIAAAGHSGTAVQESLIGFGLISLSVAMLIVSLIVLWGLRGGPGMPNDINV